MNPLPKNIRLTQLVLGMIGAEPSLKNLFAADSPEYAEICRLEATIKPYLGLGVSAVCQTIERCAIRHTNQYRITCTDPILPLSLPRPARPTRYEPHVGRKQLSKKNGTR